MVQELTKKNVVDIVEKSAKPVVIDFFAPWCGPCIKMKPLFAQLETELSETYVFASLNVDEERDLAIHYGITSLPTFLFIKNNAIVGRRIGYMNQEDLKAEIKSHLE